MSTVTVKLKDGTKREFNDTRGGGSYNNYVKYEGVFAVVVDVWGNQTSFPAVDVQEIKYDPELRGGW